MAAPQVIWVWVLTIDIGPADVRCLPGSLRLTQVLQEGLEKWIVVVLLHQPRVRESRDSRNIIFAMFLNSILRCSMRLFFCGCRGFLQRRCTELWHLQSCGVWLPGYDLLTARWLFSALNVDLQSAVMSQGQP
jgi:hypothetical protein